MTDTRRHRERDLPTGTVTFLFTDIEGSTRLLQEVGPEYEACLRTHASLIREAVAPSDGVEVSTEGDAFFVVFPSAPAALAAAARAQWALAGHRWPPGAEVRVRMGLHTGNGVLGGDNYVGIDVHKAARIASAGHGGQVLLSEATALLAEDQLPDGVVLKDLGERRLQDLAHPQRLYQLVLAGLPSQFPPLRTLDAVPNNLPVQLTSFVGRERELSEAVRLLEQTRLLTLTGPGGTGKTRLSMQVAAESSKWFGDGVFFVPLSAISDPDLVPTAVLEGLGLRTTASGVQPRDHLLAYLAGKRLLLVLDNFEQILDAAPLAGEMLEAGRDIKLIVTSRAPLRIRGEQEMPVPPLQVPDLAGVTTTEAISHFEGVELFTERAMAIRPDFELNSDNALTVAQITVRLDGLPLAIELAASRVNLLTPAVILERLDNRLLASPSRDLPARQQTLINAIGWSYDLLTEPCRRLFERLSVFIGGAMLEQIEQVCGPPGEIGIDILDGLAVLVDHSLVRQHDRDGLPRFGMLTVIREFAQGALVARDDDDELRRRHAHAYLGLAELAEPHLLTSHQRIWLDRLAADHDNLRGAIDWAVGAGDAETALHIVGALWRFWQIRGHLYEARDHIEAALALPGASPATRSKALEALGGVAYWSGEESTLPAYEEALAIMRQHGQPADIANALYNLSFPVGSGGDYDRAGALLEESLAIYEELGDRHGIGRAYWGVANQAFYADDFDRAIDYSARSAAEFEKLDAPFDLGWAWYVIGDCLREKGDVEGARNYFRRALPAFTESGDLSAVVLFLHEFAGLAAMGGDRLRAARLAGARHALAAKTGVALIEAEFNIIEELEVLLGETEDDLQAAFMEGEQMTTEEAVAYVLEGDGSA